MAGSIASIAETRDGALEFSPLIGFNMGICIAVGITDSTLNFALGRNQRKGSQLFSSEGNILG